MPPSDVEEYMHIQYTVVYSSFVILLLPFNIPCQSFDGHLVTTLVMIMIVIVAALIGQIVISARLHGLSLAST